MRSELEHYVALLSIHRDALKILSQQLARFGDNAPVHKELEYANRLEECTNHIADAIELMKNEHMAETEALSVLSVDLSERGVVSAITIIRDVINQLKAIDAESRRKHGGSFDKSAIISPTVTDKVRSLLSRGETEEAIVFLVIETKDSALNDTALLLSGQYRILKKRNTQGAVTQEEFDARLTDINRRILELLA